MRKADEPAFPTKAQDFLVNVGGVPLPPSWPGLSKREYFACHAPITIDDVIRHINYFEPGSGKAFTDSGLFENWAKLKVQYADALIAALAETKPV